MTLHQRNMLETFMRIPMNTSFTAGDAVKKYGYPHKDASRVLQQLISWAISYANPRFAKNKIQYIRDKSDNFYITILAMEPIR